ncbi:helix-turn-helix transcriptional regulator [Mycobacterium sp. 4D054]|uniref:helix-turn-helix transcriptional regulator n=1 Tax=Mycobacterium sp. 4D054 TaxID=3457440 RepID=UPI003FD08AF2
MDDAEFNFHVTTDMDPSDGVMLCRVRSGLLGGSLPGRPVERYGAGSVVAFGGRCGERICGDIDRARYDVIVLDRDLLGHVAAGTTDGHAAPVDLTSMRPLSEEANRHIADVMAHLRLEVGANAHAVAQPLVTGPLLRYLAGCVLAAFPNTAAPAPRADGAGPQALERALAFIDDHADTDISLADIAAAARVTPQSVHALFAAHMNCTPRAYLRKVRLHCAHRDLVANNPGTATVADIAARWGFGVVEAFTVYYRSRYGVCPETTLAA